MCIPVDLPPAFLIRLSIFEFSVFDVLRSIFINKTIRSAIAFSHEPAEYGIELPLYSFDVLRFDGLPTGICRE